MAALYLTSNGQSTTRTVPDNKALAILTALRESSGLAESATVAQKVNAGLDLMLADAVKAARAFRKAQRYQAATVEVDGEIGLG